MHPINIQKGIEIARRYRDNGIFHADVGSISIRDGENIWITKSREKKYSDNAFTLVDANGNSISDPGINLSGEYPIHKRILDDHQDYNAVIHTHTPLHVAFGNVFPNYCFDQNALEMRKILDNRNPEGSFTLRTIANSFNKKELSENVSNSLKDSIAVLVKGHGLFVAGANIKKANDYVMGIDHLIHQVYLECQMRKS